MTAGRGETFRAQGDPAATPAYGERSAGSPSPACGAGEREGKEREIPEGAQGRDKMAPRFKRCALRAGGRGRWGGRRPGGVHCACARSCKMADSAELKVKRSSNSLRDAARGRAPLSAAGRSEALRGDSAGPPSSDG